MSVDYNCGIAFGWKVSQTERDAMVAYSDYAYEDDFICVDGYRENGDYIFGVWLCRDSCNGVVYEISLPQLALSIPDDFIMEANTKLRMMGCGDWVDDTKHPRHLPRMYVVGQVC